MRARETAGTRAAAVEIDTCGNCRFWQALTGTTDGYCRCRAPLAQYFSGGGARCIWPIVAVDDWCGEHEHPKPQVQTLPAEA